jgi:hypothetical protein
MRVSISATGSFTNMDIASFAAYPLPAGLDNARDLALASQLAEAATAHVEFTHIRVDTAAERAARVGADLELGLSLLLYLHCLSGHYVCLLSG